IRGFSRLRKKSVLRLILGGAAVHRCGKWLVSGVSFSRCGETATWKVLFPQPVSPRGYSLSPANPYTKHALVKLQSRHKNGAINGPPSSVTPVSSVVQVFLRTLNQSFPKESGVGQEQQQ